MKPPPGLVAKLAQYGFKLETMEVEVVETSIERKKAKKRPEWKARVVKRYGKPFVVTIHAYTMKQAKRSARMIKGVVKVISVW